ncbi:MAG: hypothetical protein IJW35_06220 [Lentisphaeria bacterium]|nr:hypothetical protein [Lentisphaeria bacterium]
MKKFLTGLLAVAVGFTAGAAVTAEYAFELTVDETLQDLSGNENHPQSNMQPDSWINEGFEAVRFAPGKFVRVPAKAFPGARGAVTMFLRHEQPLAGKSQRLFTVYSPQGDGFCITSKKGMIRAAFYDRSEKKWYLTDPGKALPLRRFVSLAVTWELPGKIALYVEGVRCGEIAVPVTPQFRSDSQVYIGTDQQGNVNFAGALHRFKLENTPVISGTDDIKAAPERCFAVMLGGFGLRFAEKSLGLRGMSFRGIEYISTAPEALWTIKLRHRTSGKYLELEPGMAKSRTYSQKENRLTLKWQNIPVAGGQNMDVTAFVSLSEKNELSWRLSTSKLRDDWAVDMVTYPRLGCAPTAFDVKEMYLTYPRYYGVDQPDPFTYGKPSPGMRYGNVYPGGAHMQFGYLYGKNVPGIYFHAADPDGHYKEFLWTASPEENSLLFTLGQFPEQRGLSPQFVSAYPVKTAIIDGDWYDAARRYRAWAVKQPWCAIGKLAERTDLPKWVYDMHISTRPSTLPKFPLKMAAAKAKIPDNMVNIRKLFRELDCGALTVWYNYNCAENADSVFSRKKQMAAFNARKENISIPGVRAAVDEMRNHSHYCLGYINSRIFDEVPGGGHAETEYITPAVMLDINGKFQRYSNLPFDVCRAADLWRNHLIGIIRTQAKENGFAGMYLDSFGRGQYHCYAANHDHKPGENTASVQGQRKMAQMIKSQLRREIPGFVISSEASIEQFVDLIDFKLHHHNIFTHAVPLWTVVYHDYQFVYGRTVSRPRIQVTACFHIGALLGRIFTDSPANFEKTYFQEGIYAYYRKLIAMRKRFYGQIVVGEMLRTPEVVCDVPAQKISLKGSKFEFPAVVASAWRDGKGVPVAFFTNHTDKVVKFTFALDKKEFTTAPKQWVIAGDDGKFTVQKFAGNELVLPPLGVAALEF